MGEAMASTSTTAQGAPAEAPIPPPKPFPIEKSTQTERVGKFVPIPAKIPTPHKEVTPASASQIGSTSPITLPVIFVNNPFVVLSQAVKDGSILVVTPSSIPNSTTQGPNANFSSDEGSEEVLEDSKNDLSCGRGFLNLMRMVVVNKKPSLWVYVSCPWQIFFFFSFFHFLVQSFDCFAHHHFSSSFFNHKHS